jgi:hypothetical protein
MYLLIFESIERAHLMQFMYEGVFRIIEPHMYGSDASGMDLLCGFQIAGTDGLGKNNGWHKFEVSKISDLQRLPTRYPGPRHPYRLASKTFKRIYCQATSPSLERSASKAPTLTGDMTPGSAPE